MKHGAPGSGLSRSFLAVAVLSLAGFLELALVAAGHQFSELDQRTRALVQLTRLPFLDPAMRGISGLGDLEAHWVSDLAGGFTLGLAYLLSTICLVATVARLRGAASEAQVDLADDERRVADVDPVVVTV